MAVKMTCVELSGAHVRGHLARNLLDHFTRPNASKIPKRDPNRSLSRGTRRLGCRSAELWFGRFAQRRDREAAGICVAQPGDMPNASITPIIAWTRSAKNRWSAFEAR
jgi:hypothetical protein